jgi:hypothetical protein
MRSGQGASSGSIEQPAETLIDLRGAARSARTPDGGMGVPRQAACGGGLDGREFMNRSSARSEAVMVLADGLGSGSAVAAERRAGGKATSPAGRSPPPQRVSEANRLASPR